VISQESSEIGLGDIKDARMTRAISQIVDSYELSRTPTPAEVFDRSFLPPRSERLVK
jgi:NitT/TauT family transport system substrate-binding protein